jgi:hypothetical protein
VRSNAEKTANAWPVSSWTPPVEHLLPEISRTLSTLTHIFPEIVHSPLATLKYVRAFKKKTDDARANNELPRNY